MSRYDKVPESWRKRILAYNRQRAQDATGAQDLRLLVAALPPGICKQLMKDAACAAILSRHGVEG